MTNHSKLRQQVDQRLSNDNAAIPGGGGNNPSLLPKYLVSSALSRLSTPLKSKQSEGLAGRREASNTSLFGIKAELPHLPGRSVAASPSCCCCRSLGPRPSLRRCSDSALVTLKLQKTQTLRLFQVVKTWFLMLV